MRRARVGVLIAVLAGLLIAPSASSAAVTIGSDLSPDPDSAGCALNSCTVLQSGLVGAHVTSPIDGVIVRWAVRGDANGGDVDLNLVVARPDGGGTYTATASSPTHTFSDTSPTTRSYPANLPIAQGSAVGVTVSGPAFNLSNFLVQVGNSAAQLVKWTPPLVPPEMRPSSDAGQNEVMLNADIEPDCDSDGFGDETQDTDTSTCISSSPDNAAPDTTITGGPKAKTRKRSATFTYTGTDASGISGFECKLDAAAFEPCPASKTYSRLKRGKHTFDVRAVDNAGNVDLTPATRTWKVKKKKKKK